VAVGHSLGVPLDGDEEAARPFDPLDDPIGGNGAGREIGRQVADDGIISSVAR
jgi:hypothetical protein